MVAAAIALSAIGLKALTSAHDPAETVEIHAAALKDGTWPQNQIDVPSP